MIGDFSKHSKTGKTVLYRSKEARTAGHTDHTTETQFLRNSYLKRPECSDVMRHAVSLEVPPYLKVFLYLPLITSPLLLLPTHVAHLTSWWKWPLFGCCQTGMETIGGHNWFKGKGSLRKSRRLGSLWVNSSIKMEMTLFVLFLGKSVCSHWKMK